MVKPNGTPYKVRLSGPAGHKVIAMPVEAQYDWYRRYIEKDGRIIFVPIPDAELPQ